MFVTRETDYAVRCVLFLCGRGEGLVSVGEIAAGMGIPPKFLAKILQRLVRAGLLSSSRGAHGGFRLLHPPAAISLWQVIEAIPGPSAANRGASDAACCERSSHCPIHPLWVEIRQLVEQRLAQETFEVLLARNRQALPGAAPPPPTTVAAPED